MPDDRFGFLDVGVPKALTPPAGYEAVHVAGMSWAIQGASLETTSWLSPAQWNHIIAQFRGLLTIASIDLSDVPDTSPLLLRETLVRAIEAAILANASVIDIEDAIDTLKGSVPADLDTLEKIAASIGDDDDFSGTVNTALTALASAVAAKIATADLATGSNYQAATAGKVLSTTSVWSSLTVLTAGASITVDFNTGDDFGGASNAPLALTGNATLLLTNPRNKKKGIVWFTATGSTRTLTLDAAWVLATGAEVGPYSITTSQTLGVAYVTRGTTVVVTGIVRTG